MAEAAPKEKWKMARYRPTMDFAKVNSCTIFIYAVKICCQAKMVIGLPSGAKAEELDPQDIHEKFVKKLAQVTT